MSPAEWKKPLLLLFFLFWKPLRVLHTLQLSLFPLSPMRGKAVIKEEGWAKEKGKKEQRGEGGWKNPFRKLLEKEKRKDLIVMP